MPLSQASQLEFFAGLVTEMKGHSVPMGPSAINFSVREPLGIVAKIIPFNHPFMFAGWEDRGSARCWQFSDCEAARAGSPLHVAIRRVD